ncbi:MAG: zinc ribbon domain-containing protein, partial [Candidatus Heimdallarchaeota archaeon]|nr:zinc ribbon domain-containing protein [Candidatus Heimdallarchaeota archaeon]
CELHLVNPYHSSTKHANCGGNLKRSRDHYDITNCGKCNIMVNTHLNAAINLVSSTIRSRS